MPGIVGLITKMPREWAEPQLQRMVKSIYHESFYVTGVWIDESLGVYVGWAEQKDSFAANMPVQNEMGNVVLVFSGEEFPEPGTVVRLKERGHDLGLQEASYLVHLYEEDPAFPINLNGRFQGILVDKKHGTAMLFNDRYGMDQVYYHESKEAFYFACEAKAILAVRNELRTIGARELGEFISCGCVLDNRTIFREICLLPGAAAWTFRDGAIEKRRSYFDQKEWEAQESLAPEPFYQQLREIFARNLPRYFNGRQRRGMSLTGGLDTRMIMAWQKESGGSLPCYTFGGTYRDCRDVIVARQVAQVCGQNHEVITVGGDFLKRFSRYAERSVFLTDGAVDMSRTPALYANEKAREIAPVRIAGIYGSEVLRWLPGFKPTKLAPGIFDHEILVHVDAAKKTYEGMFLRHPISFVLFHQAPQRGVNTLEESQLTVRSPYLDNDFVRTAFRAPNPSFARSDILSKKDVSLRLISDGNPDLGLIRTDRGLAGPPGYISAVLARLSLEFTFKSEWAYDYGMPQAVARVDHVLARLQLERLFLGRHKFYHFRVWYRDQLSGYVRQMLLDSRSRSRPYVDAKRLESIVEDHTKGNQNYTLEIHKLLTLELIHRLFVDGQ